MALRRACPEIVLGTHVLVGFPGEREADFALTLEFLRQVGFSYVEAFTYEERADTESAGMREKVPGVVKHWRLWRLRREFRPVCRIH